MILDTDIGDNVDDAFALALACREPRLSLLGVTTVYRDARARGAIAASLLDALGRADIPVVPGAADPLGSSVDRAPPRLMDSGYVNYLERVDGRDGVDFLIETAERHAARSARSHQARLEASCDTPTDRLVVCCIGPLTNLAVALTRSPALAARIRVVWMGGMRQGTRAETNAAADPDAVRVVLESGTATTVVPYDVTCQCEMNEVDVSRVRSLGSEPGRWLSAMMDLWMERTGRLPIPHDALAVALCADANLCVMEAMEVTVAGGDRSGRFVARGRPDSPVRMCVAVDRPRFMAMFLDRICGEFRERT